MIADSNHILEIGRTKTWTCISLRSDLIVSSAASSAASRTIASTISTATTRSAAATTIYGEVDPNEWLLHPLNAVQSNTFLLLRWNLPSLEDPLKRFWIRLPIIPRRKIDFAELGNPCAHILALSVVVKCLLYGIEYPGISSGIISNT